MILFKNHLIIGFIFKVLKWIIKFLYKILKFFNLHVTLLIILVGIILFFAGVFEGNPVMETVFYVVLVASIFLGVIAAIERILFPKKKDDKKKRNKVDIVKNTDQAGAPGVAQNTATSGAPTQMGNEVAEKPRYYKVKQNNDYIMAEYSDRYELFIKTPSGLRKVRTDLKGDVR